MGIFAVIVLVGLSTGIASAKEKAIKLSELRIDSLQFISQTQEKDLIQARLVNGKQILIHDSQHRFQSALLQSGKESQNLLRLVLNLSLAGIDYVGKAPMPEQLTEMIAEIVSPYFDPEKEVHLSKARTLAQWLAQLAKDKKLGPSQFLALSN